MTDDRTLPFPERPHAADDPPVRRARATLLGALAEFEQTLDDGHEAWVRFGSATGEAFRLQYVEVVEPDHLVFNCVAADGAPMVLVQHHTQLNMLLVALNRPL